MTKIEIQELRREMDRINRELLSVLSRRGALAKEIGYCKQEKGLPYYDPEREAEILQELVKNNPGPYPDKFIRETFTAIFRASIELMSKDEEVELLASRKDRENTVIKVKDIEIGNGTPVIIGGPCSVESMEQLEKTAEILRKEGVRLLRAGLFKPRTSPYSFQGLKNRGIDILRQVSKKYNLAVVSEITDPRQLESLLGAVDILQVGSRNMYNYELLKELGRIGTPILLKRGFMATIDELMHSAEYILSRGNGRVILCERGIRTFENQTRNTLDISAIPILKQSTHLPVIVDISHSLGRTDISVPVAKAALSAGADGIMAEVHYNPREALSDSAQQLNPEQFSAMMKELKGFIKI